ncbi:MAG: tetratricopeptide repeat protein [Nitrospinae bacterium]|nr:tetratricopeptide repeat protein [Nitrospinota bacterium]
MRVDGRVWAIIVLPAAFLLLAGCANIRALFTPREQTEPVRQSKPAPDKKAQDPHFFRVLTLPTYEIAKEAYDKTAILGIPFRKVAREFKDKATAIGKAQPSELSVGARAEVQDLKLGGTSRIIESDEGFSILQKTTSAHYERALALMEKKKDAAALNLIRRDLKINPGNVEAWLALAKMMDEAGDLEETLAAYRKARELDPGNPLVSNRYARYLVSQYRFEEAEEILRDAEKKSPEDAGVLLNLASLLVYLNKEPDFASRLIERGSRVDPGRPAWYRLSGVIRKRRELGIPPKGKGVN